MTVLHPALLLMSLAQNPESAIIGTVRDESTGRPLAHAIVGLPDLGRSVSTDVAGRYRLSPVPPGPQHLSFRLVGYTHRRMHALVPRAGPIEINVSLRPEPVRLPGIEVRPDIALRGVETSADPFGPERETTLAAIQNHPLLSEPDALQGMSGGDVAVRPEQPDGVHVRGGASDQTGYLLDGIPVFSPYHAAGLFSAWNPDALARVELWSAGAPLSFPDVLSGTIAGETRVPGPEIRMVGSTSTTQARAAIDGPLPGTGIGFLASLRLGFPGLIAPGDEASYVTGESGDWLFKVEGPLLGGSGQVLAYFSDNEVTAASVAAGEGPTLETTDRHSFEWASRSIGARWRRDLGTGWSTSITAWQARGLAAATWWPGEGAVTLGADRRDYGVGVTLTRARRSNATLLGIRGQWTRADYDVAGAEPDPLGLEHRAPHAAAFAQQTIGIGTPVSLAVGGALSLYDGTARAAPRAQVRWTPRPDLELEGSLGRSHQFAQSLRNPESVAGLLFPADLYVGAGAAGLPVAQSDQAAFSVGYRPLGGVRIGLQGFARRFSGLALVAPVERGPFAVRDVAAGSGTAQGLAAEFALSTARVGALASYGFQHTRYRHGTGSFIPGHAGTHGVEGGVIVFPDPTLSFRVGAAGLWGRRGTPLVGGFEFESCNLLDRGCEFAGSPLADSSALGTSLPAYFRVDLSARKHWHLEVAGRDAFIGVFATLSNLLERRNLLTQGFDPALGLPFDVEMRPLAPLVLGVDWRF